MCECEVDGCVIGYGGVSVYMCVRVGSFVNVTSCAFPNDDCFVIR